MITDLLMTGAGLPFTKRNGMMVVKKFADCPQEMDFNSNADNLYHHDHKSWLQRNVLVKIFKKSKMIEA